MDYEQMNNNQVVLCGVLNSELVFTHRVCGEGFYESVLSVRRLSEQFDLVPITISERLIADNQLKVGDEIMVSGQFRSYNKWENEKSKLMLTMFVREIITDDPIENPNSIYLNGYVCKPPIYRTTPFNREICDILIAVNRAYNKSDYIPCICWGRNAKFAKGISVGDNIAIIGRIQSREYSKKIDEENVETHMAYEVSVSKIAVNSQIEFLENDFSYKFLNRYFEAEAVSTYLN